MIIKIDDQILSLPPYISTTWENVASLHVENLSGETFLVITLSNGKSIKISNLNGSLIETIFSAHALHHSLQNRSSNSKPSPLVKFLTQDASSLEEQGELSTLEHNPALSQTPPLPPPFLQKFAETASTLGLSDPDLFPQPEEKCNCPHCQLIRAIRSHLASCKEAQETLASDEELTFSEWTIVKQADKLYLVINTQEDTEHYLVYLGKPFGCTCGNKDCAHIQAVLKT